MPVARLPAPVAVLAGPLAVLLKPSAELACPDAAAPVPQAREFVPDAVPVPQVSPAIAEPAAAWIPRLATSATQIRKE